MGNVWEPTRRSFLRLLALAGAGGLLGAWGGRLREAHALSALGRFRAAEDPKNPTALERAHTAEIQLPRVAGDGANVPIVIDMDHEQRPGDYIKSIEIFNFNDPIISKGVYHFTPASGRVHLSAALRMDRGRARVYVVAECTRHGKWIAHRSLKVERGGC
ncbi:MAG: thiosulfate oxidation carrier protein SoxY [bacterium]